jgi:hypothetical protein
MEGPSLVPACPPIHPAVLRFVVSFSTTARHNGRSHNVYYNSSHNTQMLARLPSSIPGTSIVRGSQHAADNEDDEQDKRDKQDE